MKTAKWFTYTCTKTTHRFKTLVKGMHWKCRKCGFESVVKK